MSSRNRATRCGLPSAITHLAKPLSEQVLLDTIHEALEGSRQAEGGAGLLGLGGHTEESI